MFSFQEPECYAPLSAYKNCLEHVFFFFPLVCCIFLKAVSSLKLVCQHFLVGVCSVAVCSLLSSDVVLRETISLALIGGKSLKRL